MSVSTMFIRDALPWLAVAGLGAVHGLHPASGWLFAAGMGLRRNSRKTIYVSLVPIVIGHALSIVMVAGAFVVFGWVAQARSLATIAGFALVAWALLHALRGDTARRHTTNGGGMLGLLGWSFVISMTHGTGLLLVPVVLPLCLSGSPAGELFATSSMTVAIAALGLHLTALLVTTALGATAAYHCLGVRSEQWRASHLHHLWHGALFLTGLALLL